ncbi:MAG: 30S ribosome-binding factor RbfA [Chloroflexi bacterium]|jgi:ribosome-binding factor A|nr:30S ribosome-binding factor RbfA [Chloroflexota bacterium]
MAFRRERGDSFIREELTLAIRNELSDPRIEGAVVTEVELTKDRRFARVYVSHYEGEEALQAALAGLEGAKGVLRRHLSQVLAWRFTPELGFYADRAWAHGARIDALFEQLEQEQGPDVMDSDEQDDADDE